MLDCRVGREQHLWVILLDCRVGREQNLWVILLDCSVGREQHLESYCWTVEWVESNTLSHIAGL